MAQQGMDPGAGGASAQEIVQNVADTIGSLAQAAAESRPDVAQKLQAIYEEFSSVMAEFMGGQGGGGGGQRPQPMPERGQGMPQGPQGAM
jgi:hypothetical protein